MKTIDLNADLGELGDGSLDAAVMPSISSANIACGAHAGSIDTMRRTVRLAKAHGVAIGAHPGYPDPENFGRISKEYSALELCALIRDQVLLLRQIAAEEDYGVQHVKLHGALYNDLAFDYDRSLAVAKTMADMDSDLRLIVFSGSETARAAEDAGLVVVHEVFADRAYTKEGRLMPRSLPGAVIHDEEQSLTQVGMMVLEQRVPVYAGDASGDPSGWLPIQADSVCVHGDNPSAVCFVERLRDFFKELHIEIAPVGEDSFRCFPLGERSLLARLPSRISKATHRRIRALYRLLDGHEGVLELVPCYAELKVDFDPEVVSFEGLRNHIQSLTCKATDFPEPRVVEVPVVYEGEDLARVAEHNGLSVKDVVRLHSGSPCLVYMLGFSPGFAYMGGLDPSLTTPRLDVPRVSVPAGSVGIAGRQTGIYPVESPGGWNIIGRTALKLFDPEREDPFLFEPGDKVRFVKVWGGSVKGVESVERVERVKGVEGVESVEGVEGGGAMSSLSRLATVGRQGIEPVGSHCCAALEVLDPGMYTTVQDGGRCGFLRYGLPPSGAMDKAAYKRANALLGNDPGAAVLECTGTMPVLESNAAVRIAVVYVDREFVLDAAAGEAIRFEPILEGYRAYISMEGGIEVPRVMGSRSTYVPAGLGGLDGRVLRSGDVLNVGCRTGWKPAERPAVPPASGRSGVVRVIPGPEADWFDCGGLNTFLTEEFAVSSKSDRTGIRLEGLPLSFHVEKQMLSSGLTLGTIQVPPSGQPMVMMADHPTVGGYPRIGCVVEEDLPMLAQLRPGDRVRFKEGA